MLYSFHFAVLLIACCSLRPAFADDVTVADESAAEAVVLYNFALLTEWPDLPAEEFRICVLGSEPMLAALEPVKKRWLKERPVTITNISPATQVQSCQVLFVDRSEHASINNLASQIGNAPVMVISEENDYDPQNANVIIALVPQKDRMAFKVNRTKAQANSLTISSKLLKLAILVY